MLKARPVSNSLSHLLLMVFLWLTASRNSVEDAYYEDADDNYPITRINGHPKHSCEHGRCFPTN